MLNRRKSPPNLKTALWEPWKILVFPCCHGIALLQNFGGFGGALTKLLYCCFLQGVWPFIYAVHVCIKCIKRKKTKEKIVVRDVHFYSFHNCNFFLCHGRTFADWRYCGTVCWRVFGNIRRKVVSKRKTYFSIFLKIVDLSEKGDELTGVKSQGFFCKSFFTTY